MKPCIAILHYAGPPGVGGVESMIAYQSRGLAALGYPVRLVSGKGGELDFPAEIWIDPLFGSTHPDVLAVKRELDTGLVSPAFEKLVQRIYAALKTALADCPVCIAHNVLSLNKNLPLTVALKRLAQDEDLDLIGWCSDLAWTNPQYQPELHPGFPWDLLRTPWPRTRYVTISEARQEELSSLFGLVPDEVVVVTPGVDPAAFFQWTQTMRMIEDRLHLQDADVILLLPARLTRRKNIGLALHVLAALRRDTTIDYRLIVTGPPGPHNPTNPGYMGELLDLRQTLELQHSVHFLYELGEPVLNVDNTTIANLYQLADALLFPSLQEGFGIPLLEAGLVGLPIFCSNLPPFHQIAPNEVQFFDPLHDSPEAIAAIISRYFEAEPRYQLKKRVRQHYRWERIVRDQIVPLLENQ